MHRIFSSIILINIFFGIVCGQTARQIYSLANKLFKEERYEAAIPFYTRTAFFSDSLKAMSFYKIGMSNLYQGNFAEAEHYLEFASQSETSDSSRCEILMDKALLYLLSDRYDLAQLELAGIDDAYVYNFFERFQILTGVSLMGQHKYEESKDHFKLILPVTEYYKLDSLIGIAIKWDNKKTGIAFYSSLCLPGSGQLLYGNIKESVNSLMLNSGLIALMYLVYTEYGFLDATLSVLPWLGRYYLGGAIKAENLALQKKQMMHNKILYETLTFLESNLENQYTSKKKTDTKISYTDQRQGLYSNHGTLY